MNDGTIIVRRHPGIARGYERGSKEIEINGMKLFDLTSTDYEWYRETKDYSILKEEELDKYIDYISSLVGGKRILVVSSHQVVKNKLEALGYRTLAVYPNKDMFKDFLREAEGKGDTDKEELDYLNKHWFPFVKEMAEDTLNSAHIEVFNPKVSLLELLEEYIKME